jgi:predicted dehydrogenase
VEQHNQVDDDATITLDYPDATVTIEASWDWPYGMDRVEVFGPKGSLLATRADLFFHPAKGYDAKAPLEGEKLAIEPADRKTSNPVAYFVDCIRNDKPIEELLSAKLNVQVMEILDAARESAGTGRGQGLH